MGERAWRCRTCQHRFYAKGGASIPIVPGKRRKRKSSEKPPGLRLSNRNKRRLIEAALFAAMLFVFYLFLRYITREPSVESGRWQTGPRTFAQYNV
jgi:hypothetical protein